MSKVVLKCEPSSEDAVRSLRCESCGFQTDDYRTKWRDHLLGQQHQKITWEKYVVDEFCLFCERMSLHHPSSRMSKYVESKKRSCVVFGIGGLPRRDVLRFFCEKAVVTEFIFWEQRPQICLVEFLLRKAAEDVAKETKSICGDDVVVRLRVEISDVEWERIRPVSVERGVEEMEGLEMRDDSSGVAIEKNEPSDTLGSPFTLSSSDLENNNERCQSSRRKRKCRGCSEFECRDCWDALYKATQRGSSVGKRETRAGCSEFECCEWEDTPQPATSCLPGSSKFPTDTSNTSTVCVPPPPKKKRRGGLIDGPKMSETVPLLKLLFGGVLCDILCPFHSLPLNDTKKFVAKVGGVKGWSIETVYENLQKGLWVEMVNEFNLLVWENLWGFQLHELTSADIPKMRNLKKEAVQCAPLMRAALTRIDWLTKWAQTSPPKQKIMAAQDLFMKDWMAGLVKPTPLRPSHENAGSVGKSVFLCFDLRVVYAPPIMKHAENHVCCRLEFYNIATSCGKQNWELFEQIRKIYLNLFKRFCKERLKQF